MRLATSEAKHRNRDATSPIAKLQGNGYPFRIKPDDRGVLYNLPEGVISYVISVGCNELVCAYLVYADKVELVHVLSEAGCAGNNKVDHYFYVSDIVQVASFSQRMELTQMIVMLMEICRDVIFEEEYETKGKLGELPSKA